MQHPMITTEERPSRAEIEPAALAVLTRHSAALLATARHYSATPEDAEDAYQRGVEILLTKAPTTREEELLPWLKTVVKHESFAVRKSSSRAALAAEPLDGEPDQHAWTDERAERYEQLRVGAEAMAGLKPQEIRCLLLKAEGLSYQEICEATGFSYTKVNRCLTEGRRAFLKRVAGIEAGAECERLAPLISKVADGEASAEEMRVVRPHLKGCLACKATLREYRATPSRLAGLVPPVVALAGGGGGGAYGLLGRLLERFAAISDVGGAKVAAVAASGVLLAGGGAAAGVDALDHEPRAVAPSTFAERDTTPTQRTAAAAPASAPAASAPAPSTAAIEAVADAARAPTPKTKPKTKPDPLPEFDPGVGGDPTPSESGAAAAQPPASTPAAPETPASTPRRSTPAAPEPGEFGP